MCSKLFLKNRNEKILKKWQGSCNKSKENLTIV